MFLQVCGYARDLNLCCLDCTYSRVRYAALFPFWQCTLGSLSLILPVVQRVEKLIRAQTLHRQRLQSAHSTGRNKVRRLRSKQPTRDSNKLGCSIWPQEVQHCTTKWYHLFPSTGFPFLRNLFVWRVLTRAPRKITSAIIGYLLVWSFSAVCSVCPSPPGLVPQRSAQLGATGLNSFSYRHRMRDPDDDVDDDTIWSEFCTIKIESA